MNRKKLTRAILFEYLNARKIPISGQAEKSALITRTLELWNSESQQVAAVVSPITPSISHQESPSQTPEMGLQFTKWFYELLFAVHKQSATGTKLSEQFWRDARLKITLNSSGTTDCQETIGSDEVCFISSATHSQLLFIVVVDTESVSIINLIGCQSTSNTIVPTWISS